METDDCSRYCKQYVKDRTRVHFRRIGIFDRRRGPSSLGLPEGVKESVVKVGIVHGSLPSFRSCYSGKILRAAITHYKANRRNTGYNELSDERVALKASLVRLI